MNYSKQTWDQLKNLTADNIVSAIKKDEFVLDETDGAIHVYYRPSDKRRISIHYHPHKTYGSNLLKRLLDDIGWSEDRMRDLKLIK